MKRITISVPDGVYDKAQRAVASGDYPSVSAYFSGVVGREPDWAGARTIVSELEAESGGITAGDRAWARESLGIGDKNRDIFMRTVIFDTGALIALEKRDKRMTALLAEIITNQIPAVIPAGVLAQAWRASPRQHPIARLLQTDAIRVEPLDRLNALSVGALLADSGQSDVTDGHVALLARKYRATVFTSDYGDIAAIDPSLDIVRI